MGKISLMSIPGLIKRCYTYFGSYFFGSIFVNNFASKGRVIANGIVFTMIVVLFSYWLFKSKKKRIRKSIIVAAVLLLPMEMMSIVLLAPDASVLDSTGSIMLPTVGFIFLLLAVLIGEVEHIVSAQCVIEKWIHIEKKIKLLVVLATMFSLIMVLELALDCQTYMYANLLKTISVAEQLRSDLNLRYGSINGQKVMIMGNMEDGNYPELNERLKESVQWTTASYRLIWADYGATQAGWNSVFCQYLGAGFEQCSGDEYYAIRETGQFESMMNYPDEGSVEKINDIIVVRLSDCNW